MQELAEVRLTAWVHGYVQGVGFGGGPGREPWNWG